MGVNFRYSGIYDSLVHKALGKEFKPDASLADYRRMARELEAEWRPKEQSILFGMESATGLKFRMDVECYLITHDLFAPFSDPLTIGIHKPSGELREPKRLASILCHEAIHNLFMQHKEKPPWDIGTWRRLWPDEPWNVQNHIPVYAVLESVPPAADYLKHELGVLREHGLTNYLRAWEIASADPRAVLGSITQNTQQ